MPLYFLAKVKPNDLKNKKSPINKIDFYFIIFIIKFVMKIK